MAITSDSVNVTGSINAAGGKILQVYYLDILNDFQTSFTLPFTYNVGNLIYANLYGKELKRGTDINDLNTDFIVVGTTLTISDRLAGLSNAGEKLEING